MICPEQCTDCIAKYHCAKDKKGYCDGYIREEPQEQTNFQRITESPEKLAEFISNITCECRGCKRVYSASCPHHKSGLTDFCDRENALEWLKQESTE